MPRSTYSSKTFTGIKDKKIRVFGCKSETNSAGFSKPTYFDIFGMALWANYRSASGREFFASKAYNYTCEAIFTIGWHKEVKPGMYVLFGDSAYKIVYVDDLEGYKSDIKLHCEKASGVKADDLKALYLNEA